MKRKFPKQYTARLSRKDKKKQLTALKKLKKAYSKGKYLNRPKLKSYKKKKSGWTAKFHKLHPEAKTIKQISKAVKIPEKALKEVIKKEGELIIHRVLGPIKRLHPGGKHGCMRIY